MSHILSSEGTKELFRKRGLNQRFLNNLSRLGMHPSRYAVIDQMVQLSFEEPFEALNFIEFMLREVPDSNLDVKTYYRNNAKFIEVAFFEDGLPILKRKVNLELKESDIKGLSVDEIDPYMLEYTNLLNKIGLINFILQIRGLNQDTDGICEPLASSVSPESVGNFNLMLTLIKTLLPRELGGVILEFHNNDHKLNFTIGDGL